ncbi:MAG: sugar ABC transporter permease [Deinococcales bacterium]|jgi:multiple sugar transport system permease protein
MKRLPESAIGYLLIAPAFAIIVGLMLYPAVQTVWLSLHKVDLARMSHTTFVGLSNYAHIFGESWPSFLGDILPVTLYFVGASVVLQLVLGLGLAMLVNQEWLRGKEFFRATFIIPWVTSAIIIAFSWRFIYEPRLGILNYLLRGLGMANPPSWLNDPNLVMPCLIAANVWRGTAFSFIMQTAGLQSLPTEIFEAAHVDGAGAWQRFRYITLPLIQPFVVLNLILISMYTMNVFDVIYAMTNGGPLYKTEVISLYMYHDAFDFGHMGLGAAVAVLILALNLILTTIYMRLSSGRERG